MPSTSMPPPPSPLSHRRTRVNSAHRSPSTSPSLSPASSPCPPRKMSLSKGATFHVSSSPSTEDDPVLSIQHLVRRSPTGSRAALLSLIAEKEDLASKHIQDFEQTFSGARGYKKLTHGHSTARQLQAYRAVSPTDEGLGSSLSPSTEKGLASSFDRVLDLFDKDSGLGSSIHPSEEDGLAKDLIQETNILSSSASLIRTKANIGTKAISPPSAVTQSIAPRPKSPRQSRLGKLARQHISDHIIDPILREDRFKTFHPLVTALAVKDNKTVRCLRDIEQSLIFQPLTLAVSRQLYRLFGEFSIQLVVDTYHHLSENEQRRASDRPYSNGYFLDLVQQVGQLAAHIGRSRAHEQQEETTDTEMAYSPDDEVTIEGGLADTGNIAELVRWKNGKGTSLRTGLPYEPMPAIKREHTDSDDDEGVTRSMARRKKGVEPQIIETPCPHPGCDKVFTRRCDLSKHEKTHSRPYKCPHKSCKFYDMGLPTEKELERHIHDKHDPNPTYYYCRFCEFKTKRESNCKQHMEKKHDETYIKTKGASRTKKATPSATPQTPSMSYAPSEPSPASSHPYDDMLSVAGSAYTSHHATPYDRPAMSFSGNQAPQSTNYPLFGTNATIAQPEFSYPTQTAGNMQPPAAASYRNYGTASSEFTTNVHALQTPVTPTYSIISPEEPSMNDLSITMDYQPYNNNPSGLRTPNSYGNAHSRHASMHESPSYARVHAQAFQTDPTLFSTGAYPNTYFSHEELPTQEDFNFHDPVLSTFTNNAPLPASHSLFDNVTDGQFDLPEDEGMGGMDDFFNF